MADLSSRGARVSRFGARWTVVALTLAAGMPGVSAADGPPAQQLQEVRVVAAAPVPGFDVPLAQIPVHVQSARAGDLVPRLGQSLTGLLDQDFQGVSLTRSQGNPWQADLYFHGFTLSPMQGSPSGLSVYLDGVRQNEPFAETMNWDVVPSFAIRDVELVPGSNPLYGRDTLGGALLLTTKSGFTDPGGSVHLSGGSWGRRQGDTDIGMHGRRLALYAGVAYDRERGWRAYSSSRVRQAYLRGDWRPDAATAVTLSHVAAHAELHGTQALPKAWAAQPAQAYTWPDHIVDHLGQTRLGASRQLDDDWALQGLAYLRISQSRGFNSNTNDFQRYDPSSDGPLGYRADGPFDAGSIGTFYYAGLLPAYDPAHPAATLNNVPGSNVLGNVHTRGYGVSLQAVDTGDIASLSDQFTVGVSLDVGENRFSQYAQPAGFPSDPAQRGDTMGLAPFVAVTLAATTTRSKGLYAMDVLSLSPRWHLSAGVRADWSVLAVTDRSGRHPEIDGRQSFHRIDPTMGVTWQATAHLNAFFNVGEGMRTPTPIEFECADPMAPCALPNDFTGDPPLKPVVARTFSGGLRGRLDGGRLRWNVSPYLSRVRDDILTIYTGGSSQGYFANVPLTVRKGFDAGIGGQAGALRWQAGYSYVRATYGSAFSEQSPYNSSADANGTIRVRPGDRLPGIPAQQLKLDAAYRLDRRWSLGADLRAFSHRHAIGDENNRDRHGPIPGYAVLDLDLRYRPTHRLTLSLHVDNALDRRYASNGLLSDNVFDTPSRAVDLHGPGTPALFVAPGAPRGVFIALAYDWGRVAGGRR